MSESLTPLDKKGRGRPAGAGKNTYHGRLDSMGKPIADNRSYAPENASYRLSHHVCTVCMGRLLIRTVTRGRRPKVEWRCAECGDSHVLYADEPSFCWCNKLAGMYGNLFECFPNPDRKIVKNEYLVRERPHIMKAPEHIFKPAFSDYTDYL